MNGYLMNRQMAKGILPTEAGKYDVIFCDSSSQGEADRKDELEALLKEGGQIVYWKHIAG